MATSSSPASAAAAVDPPRARAPECSGGAPAAGRSGTGPAPVAPLPPSPAATAGTGGGAADAATPAWRAAEAFGSGAAPVAALGPPAIAMPVTATAPSAGDGGTAWRDAVGAVGGAPLRLGVRDRVGPVDSDAGATAARAVASDSSTASSSLSGLRARRAAGAGAGAAARAAGSVAAAAGAGVAAATAVGRLGTDVATFAAAAVAVVAATALAAVAARVLAGGRPVDAAALPLAETVLLPARPADVAAAAAMRARAASRRAAAALGLSSSLLLVSSPPPASLPPALPSAVAAGDVPPLAPPAKAEAAGDEAPEPRATPVALPAPIPARPRPRPPMMRVFFFAIPATVVGVGWGGVERAAPQRADKRARTAECFTLCSYTAVAHTRRARHGESMRPYTTTQCTTLPNLLMLHLLTAHHLAHASVDLLSRRRVRNGRLNGRLDRDGLLFLLLLDPTAKYTSLVAQRLLLLELALLLLHAESEECRVCEGWRMSLGVRGVCGNTVSPLGREATKSIHRQHRV